MKKLILLILRLYGYHSKKPKEIKGDGDGISGIEGKNYCWNSGAIALHGIYYKHSFCFDLWKKRKLRQMEISQ